MRHIRSLSRAATLVVALHGLSACKRADKPSDATGSASAVKAAPALSAPTTPATAASAMLTPCERDLDCNAPTGCRSSCIKPRSEEEGYCQLQIPSAKIGDGPCVGYRLGVGTGSSHDPNAKEKVPVAVLCDVAEGVYCDKRTRKCTAVKSVGAACSADNECGKDGECSHGKCKMAAAPGQPCKDSRCRWVA